MGMTSSPRASIALGTAAEAFGLSAYVFLVRGKEVYEPTAVLAAGVLFVALAAEGWISDPAYRGATRESHRIASALAFATLEVVIWITWFITADYGLYSKYGIGPAFVIAATLLAGLHVIERLTICPSAPIYGAIPTASAEALAATTLWVFMSAAPTAPGVEVPILGALTAALLLAIEHWARYEHFRLACDCQQLPCSDGSG